MITTDGKRYIKQYLAGQVPSIARAMALGIGDEAEDLGDKSLQFETLRLPLDLISYDVVNDKLIFKAVIPDVYVGKVYEIGLYSLPSDTLNDSPSQLITTFDQSEDWDGGTWNSTNTRVGVDSMRLVATDGLSEGATLPVSLDLSNFSPTDACTIALYASTNVSVTITFETDPVNIYAVNVTPEAGYGVLSIPKSSFEKFGAASWDDITAITVQATGDGGTGTVDFDAISFIDQDFANPDFVLISREVITPFTKVGGTVNEVEFSLSVSV